MDHQYGGGSWMMVPSQNSVAQDPDSLQSQYHPQQQQQQHHHHPSLASHFHLLHVSGEEEHEKELEACSFIKMAKAPKPSRKTNAASLLHKDI